MENEIEDKIKIIVENGIQNPEELFELLGKLGPNKVKWFRQGCEDVNFLKNNIKTFMKLEGIESEDGVDLIEELYSKNNSVVRSIDFKLLNPKYIEILGKEKVNLISCFQQIQSQVLFLKDKQLMLFSKCLERYEDKYKTEEWTTLASPVLYNMIVGGYGKLLKDIKLEELTNEELDKITQMFQEENEFGINSIEEVRKYEEIRSQKLSERINNSELTVEDKKNIVVQKIFGHSYGHAKSLIEKFGEDIDNIENEDLKAYIKSLKVIGEIKDEETLKSIFEECEWLETDSISVERALKNEYGKLFNNGLYTPKQEDLVKGYTNVYDAQTEFKMLITAVGAFCKDDVSNYKENWNRPFISTQHLCTSYIRNDMIATAEIQSICYGFSKMKEDSLMISSNHDIYSNQVGEFISRAYDKGEKYYSPEKQINSTERYNEMDFRRVQNGEKKQPDYIVVFREDGKISNMAEAQKASEQWGGMPIVIVDKDKCLQSENKKLKRMLREFKRNPTNELIGQIKQKVRNNRQTDKNFCYDIDKKIERMESYLTTDNAEKKRRRQTTKADLEENYEQVTASDRVKEDSKIKEVYFKIDKSIGGEEYARE